MCTLFFTIRWHDEKNNAKIDDLKHASILHEVKWYVNAKISPLSVEENALVDATSLLLMVTYGSILPNDEGIFSSQIDSNRGTRGGI